MSVWPYLDGWPGKPFGPVQRRPSFLIFHVEARALRDKPFDDFV